MGCDDYQYPDEDPADVERRRLMVNQFMGGALYLAKCPTCLALVESRDLEDHLQRSHAGVRLPRP